MERVSTSLLDRPQQIDPEASNLKLSSPPTTTSYKDNYKESFETIEER